MRKNRYLLLVICASFISCLSSNDSARPLSIYDEYYEDLLNVLTYGYKSNFTEVDSSSSFLSTGRKLDFAIEKEGFFKVYDEEKRIFLFTRNGHFLVNANGKVVTTEGYALLPELVITYPATISSFKKNPLAIEENGNMVSYDFKLYRLMNTKSKRNQYYTSGLSEEIADPRLWQGTLELSNVRVLSTLLNMIEISELLNNRKGHAQITRNIFLLKSLYNTLSEKLSEKTDAYQALHAMKGILDEVIPFLELEPLSHP